MNLSAAIVPEFARRPVVAAVSLAFLSALLAYFPATDNRFVFDDISQVEALRPPESFGAWIAAIGEPWWPPEKAKNLWRPTTRLALLAQRAASEAIGLGDSPRVFRFACLLLHATNAALVVALARTLGLGFFGAGVAGVVAATHPLRAEGVHQAIGQAESLAAGFMILGATLYIRARRARGDAAPSPLSAGAIATQGGVFALALGAKEHALLYPFFVALAEIDAGRARRAPYARSDAFRFVALQVVFLAILVGFFVGKARVTGGWIEPARSVPAFENELAAMSFAERLPAVAGIFGYALERFVVPVGLSPDYSSKSLPFAAAWTWPSAWLGFAAAAGLLAFALRSFVRGGRGWALVLAAFAAFGITSNLFFTIGVHMALRLWYFPLTFAALGVGIAFDAWRRRAVPESRIPALAFVALAALHVSASWNFAPAWRSMEGWGVTANAVFPEQMRAHLMLSGAAYEAKDFETGVFHARAALDLVPGNPRALHLLALNGMFLEGFAGEAEVLVRRAIQLEPHEAMYWRTMANVLGLQGKHDEAQPWLAKIREREEGR